jgi:hypothetical protein
MNKPLAGLLIFALFATTLTAKASTLLFYTTFSSTTASGLLGPWQINNAASCIWVFYTGGGATFTVAGTAANVANGPYNTNTAFGTGGVITNPGANTQWSGSTSNFPLAIEAVYSGNTSFSGNITCTDLTIGGTQTITCASGGCPTPNPVVTLSPNPYQAIANTVTGSGSSVYLMTYPDTWAYTGEVTSATTTELVAGVAGQNMYVFYSGVEAAGTNASVTAYDEYGTGATCGTGTVKFLPTPVTLSSFTVTGLIFGLYSGGGLNSLAFGPIPNLVPRIVPAGNNYCLVTAGTTIALYGLTDVAIHSN